MRKTRVPFPAAESFLLTSQSSAFQPVPSASPVLLIDKTTSPPRAGLSEALGVGYFLSAFFGPRTSSATFTGVALQYIPAHPAILHDHAAAGWSVGGFGCGLLLVSHLGYELAGRHSRVLPCRTSPPTPQSSMIMSHMVTHRHCVDMIRMPWGISPMPTLGHHVSTCRFPRQFGRVV